MWIAITKKEVFFQALNFREAQLFSVRVYELCAKLLIKQLKIKHINYITKPIAWELHILENPKTGKITIHFEGSPSYPHIPTSNQTFISHTYRINRFLTSIPTCTI